MRSIVRGAAVVAAAAALGACSSDAPEPMPTGPETEESREVLVGRMVDLCREQTLATVTDPGTLVLREDPSSLEWAPVDEPGVTFWTLTGTVRSAASESRTWICRVFPGHRFVEGDPAVFVEGVGSVLVDVF